MILKTATIAPGFVPYQSYADKADAAYGNAYGLRGLGCGCNYYDDFGDCIDPEPCPPTLPYCADLPPVPAGFQGPVNCDGSHGPVPTTPIGDQGTGLPPANCPAGTYPGVVGVVPGCYPANRPPDNSGGGSDWLATLATSLSRAFGFAPVPTGFIKRPDGTYINPATGQIIKPASSGGSSLLLIGGAALAFALIAGGKK